MNSFLMPGHNGLKEPLSSEQGTIWLWWWDVSHPMLKQRGKTSKTSGYHRRSKASSGSANEDRKFLGH